MPKYDVTGETKFLEILMLPLLVNVYDSSIFCFKEDDVTGLILYYILTVSYFDHTADFGCILPDKHLGCLPLKESSEL